LITVIDLDFEYTVTLKGVTQGYWKWHHSKA